MYIKRGIEATIDAKLKQGKVLLVTGARQAGKTTALKHQLGNSFYSDYIASYLECDVRYLINVRDEAKFYSFMVACTARTGQLLNTYDIGNVIDVDHKMRVVMVCRTIPPTNLSCQCEAEALPELH
jgi:predicted AAA+ superfamily ATPase